ncbi:hypothetical protein MG293_004083 [Ovis ammon polii]|uniref:Uncharacterized protein n=1 Tax=Ovis ammon polii TaxID=230172 RepID=A0AAD4YGX8_OVIAM|nr:hypothetical protein MG293_004083 [Ovis ammon polii]KAI4577666.1 hypothetical protein MJT46_003501 [Ovis ammon polii x Ovis aries]
MTPSYECGPEPGILSSRASANPIVRSTQWCQRGRSRAEDWMEAPNGLVRILLRALSVCQTTAPDLYTSPQPLHLRDFSPTHSTALLRPMKDEGQEPKATTGQQWEDGIQTVAQDRVREPSSIFQTAAWKKQVGEEELRPSEATASLLTKEEVAGRLLKPLTQKKGEPPEDQQPSSPAPHRRQELYNHPTQSRQSTQRVQNPA